ncbi:chromate transporter [Acinetobacter sp. NIPH 2699]|uniref:chromate transporter n=1 Tax=Acinetobacter sp. NIPH 2699 TaxID=2923433 RepID=UPI001F4B513A|nr:chromate transporter [Acinetobacter sp. NIPH 2699]MCH7336686.1 chromate transporter [Acinetobacter sp. NIPH 2699]
MKAQAISIKNESSSTVPDNKALFIGFMKLGLIGFGGVLPLAYRVIVEEQKWLNEAKFTDLLGICQILPGGNIINMAVAIGMEFQGVKGAVSSLLGLISAPTAIVLIIYQLYEHFQYLAAVKHLLQGLAAAAAGLLFATGIKMLKPILKNHLTVFTISLTFIFMLWVKLPLVLILVILLAMNMLVLGVKKS